MEQKRFALLLENVIGYSHEDVVYDDQFVRYNHEHMIIKGSLLTMMSYNEAKTICNFNPPHNYKFVSGHVTITLHCKPKQVYPVTKSQRNLLNGVIRENDRIEVLHNLDWVDKLKVESYVYVTIPTIPTPVKGIIRHIGPLKGEAGTKFGIELQVCGCS